jgi:hypothetical protein
MLCYDFLFYQIGLAYKDYVLLYSHCADQNECFMDDHHGRHPHPQLKLSQTLPFCCPLCVASLERMNPPGGFKGHSFSIIVFTHMTNASQTRLHQLLNWLYHK